MASILLGNIDILTFRFCHVNNSQNILVGKAVTYITPSLLNPGLLGQFKSLKRIMYCQGLSHGYDAIIFPDYHKFKNSSSLVLVSNTAAVALYPKNHPLAVPGLMIRVFPTFLF